MKEKDFEELLKIKIRKEEYGEVIRLLKDEIIKIYENEIKKYEKDFEYNSIFSLLRKTEIYLNNKLQYELKMFHNICNEDINEMYEIHCLIDIYNNIRGC